MDARCALSTVIAALALAGCDDGRSTALTELERAGFTDVSLVKKEKGIFEFTARKGTQACGGTVSVASSAGSSSASIVETCAGTTVAQDAACSPEHVEACGLQAEALIRKGKGSEGAELYRIGCDAGKASLCMNLGVLYADGDAGITRDTEKAASYYDKACALKNALACFNRARLYLDASPPRPDLAIGEYQKACDLGNDDACAIAAWARFEGKPPDPAGALQTFEACCARNVQRCCGGKGGLYVLGHGPGKGSKADVEAGEKLLETACDQRAGEACKNLGVLVRDGKIPPPNPARASAAFKKGCDANEGDACTALGLLLEEGKDVPADLPAALTAFQKACDKGSGEACLHAGRMLRDGRGGPKDPKGGAAQLARACSLGEAEACNPPSPTR